MSRDWDGEFASLGREDSRGFYPGSSRRIARGRVTSPGTLASVPEPKPDWDSKPLVYDVDGELREFFGIGAVAKALGRSPITLRKWEAEGIIPPAGFRITGKTSNGNRRLYTRAQVEGMVRIADEEGILEHEGRGVHISTTKFTARVKELFDAQEAA